MSKRIPPVSMSRSQWGQKEIPQRINNRSRLPHSESAKEERSKQGELKFYKCIIFMTKENVKTSRMTFDMSSNLSATAASRPTVGTMMAGREERDGGSRRSMQAGSKFFARLSS